MAQAPLIPFDYLERQKRRAQQQGEVTDPVGKALADMERERARRDLMQAPDPEQTAKVTRVAREAGEPPALIEDRVGDVERSLNVNKTLEMLGLYPAINKWAQEQPRAAAAAADDYSALGMLGQAWEDLKKVPARVLGSGGMETLGYLAEGWNNVERFNEFVGAPAAAVVGALGLADVDAINRDRERRRQQNRAFFTDSAASIRTANRGGGFVSEGLLAGLESVPMTVGAVAMRDPKMGAAALGGLVGSSAYTDARAQGLDAPSALRYAIAQGGSEALFEVGPTAELMKLSGRGLASGFARYLQEELPSEMATTLVQSFSDWVSLNPQKPYVEWAAGLPQEELQTVLGVLGGGTFTVTALKGVEKVGATVAKAQQAKQAEPFIAKVERAAAESKLRKRDPEAYAEAVAATAKDAGVSHAYVPAEAIRAYQQSDSYDQFDDPFRDYAAQIDEAEAVGGDVVLPASFAFGTLPGSAAWAAVKDDIRLAPGGMSPREADAFQAEIDDVMAELSDQALKQDRAQRGEVTAREAIVQRVSAMLQNAGFTPANAAVQAEFIAQREAVRAARMGRELTGAEFGTEVRQVLPPALADIVKADGLDLVFNAMRRGGDAQGARGQSLLEFISARGGIEDRGGDIAAMGGDKWHKGKVGKRKLLKPFNGAQGNMLGGATNDNSLERLFDEAISAGYFPDLLARREAGEKIDNHEMLDAIGQELRGDPIYADAPTTDNIRLAAAELEDLLGQRGLDPASMTDAELRDAVDALSAENEGGRAFDQSLNDGPRGRITFDNGPPIIELFQSRNLSTLLHELGHQWLEDLRVDAETEGAPEQVIADWETVKAWFAANGHPVTDGVIPVEAHEMWARGHERYLMEGKSPSSALTRLFETFRGWLLNIYRTVDQLRAPITPEIREVFDRLIATDEEIQAQREAQVLMPLFKDAAAIGMTGPEFEAYTAQATAAKDQANAALLQKTMAAIRRRETKRYNDERKGVMAQEAERLDNEPILKSIRLMRETPIDQDWLTDRMGQDVVTLLPKRVPPIYKPGGVNPDALAEMAGFTSGQQMIEVLIGAERQQREAKALGDKRTMRARMIETAADAEMTRRYGDDPFNDGSIEQEAIAAVNGELQGELLASEVRLLSRRTGARPTPYRIARQWARNKVRNGQVNVEASPGAIQRHARNVAKAGRDAEKAMLAGKMDEALRFKQQQMISSALLAEAKAAHDEVQSALARMQRVAKRKTMKSVDQDYLEQAQALLEAVDLKERTQKSIQRQGKWEAWAAAREAEGFEVVVPPSFEATLGQTNWSRLPVETFLGLDEAVKQIMHLGRLKQTLLDRGEQREWDEIFREAQDAGGNLKSVPPKDLTDPNWWDALKGRVIGADASLLKMETVFDWLDGGDPNGVFNRIVFRPIAEAQAREQDMLKDYYPRIKGLFEAVPAEVAARWQDKLELPFTDPLTGLPLRMNRHKVIAMALNVGNEGNLQRLSDGYSINSDALLSYLNETLTAEEWQFVQGVWDTIDTLWPEIARIEREVNGVAPDKVEAREVVTPFGALRGGYYPAVYDSTRDYKAEENRGRESDLFEGGYTRATTRASSTKERAEKVNRPLLLDLGVINRHLGEVIHDITHREAVIRANRMLTNERVMRMVDEALGPEIRKQFRPWLKFVANSWAIERAGNEGFGKFIGQMRANATVVGMGLRATTMVTQIAGYSNSIEVVGEAAMAKALTQFSANPAKAIDWVLENSDEVRNRMDTLDRDIRTELARLNAVTPVSKAMRSVIDAKRFVFHGIGYMDRLVSVPTWIAGYNNALAAGMSEADARYAGDKAVRQSQGAGGPKDMAAIQRGTGKWGEALKLFTMFYSYFSAQYQRERTLARDIGGADVRRSRSVPKLASRAFFLIVLPPLLVEVLRGAVGAPAGPDDEEWWAQWTMRKLLANALGPIPLVRDVFEPTWNAVAGNKVYNPSITPLQRAMDSVVKVGKDVNKLAEGEETKQATKNALELVGYSTGLVPGQVASATQFLVDVGNGDADPRGFGDWVEGLSTGKVKED